MSVKRSIRAVCLATAVVALVPIVVSAADGVLANDSMPTVQKGACHVGVRLIRATRRPAGAAPVRATRDLPMTSFLADVSDQLAPLPFTDYDTIDMAEQVVELRNSASFTLSGPRSEKHSILVQPHEVARGRVFTTVEWKDPHGDGLVSTKMRMVNGENVVLGADGLSDGPEDSSMIVSVRLSCE